MYLARVNWLKTARIEQGKFNRYQLLLLLKNEYNYREFVVRCSVFKSIIFRIDIVIYIASSYVN